MFRTLKQLTWFYIADEYVNDDHVYIHEQFWSYFFFNVHFPSPVLPPNTDTDS